MIVQASEQVFLLSGGDQVVSISELNQPTDVRKKGEEILVQILTQMSPMKVRQIKNKLKISMSPRPLKRGLHLIKYKQIKQRVSKNKMQ